MWVSTDMYKPTIEIVNLMELGILLVGCRIEKRSQFTCVHISERLYVHAYTCTWRHIHMETRHILRRPRGEAKGLGELGNKAISRIPKLINCRRSTHRILILLRVLNIVLDLIVLWGLLGQY